MAHPAPEPNESLSSWLLRVTWANGGRPHSFAHRIWPKRQIWTRDVDHFSDAVVVAKLAHGTGVTVERAFDTTIEALQGKLFEKHAPGGRTAWVLPLGIYHRTRLLYGNQFCPDCLDETPAYFRLNWRLALASTCPQHGIVLADRCPSCRAPVVPHRSGKMTVCHECLADLRRTPRHGADAEVCLFEHRLALTLDRGTVQVPELRDQHSIAFFNLVRQVLRVLASGPRAAALRMQVCDRYGGSQLEPTFPSGARDIETLGPGDRHALMTLAARTMVGWPFRFVGACLDANVFSSWALRDLHGSCFAYTDTVRSYLYRPSYRPNVREIAAARRYLIKAGREPSARAVHRLLGSGSAVSK